MSLELDEQVAGQHDPEPVIREYLETEFGDRSLGRTDDIFTLGYVNSLFALELVTFIERTFAIVLEIEDLDLANFRSIASMTDLVDAKRRSRADAPESRP
ncbi:Phosphopantetheine attachment site [Micromonospora echinospora]|uniref:Phosphopantetheine attachment site n=1 Tax=Micromonospora echinospora TaxID=1877 RepID=A0A1C4ZT14_MICEC|nr:Phosphopantetheine attachment site [Micromonospora echinospora]